MMRASASVASALLATVAVVAGVVLLGGFESDARAFLRFDFRGTEETGFEIAAQNARLVAAVLLGAAVLPRFREGRLVFDVAAVWILVGNAALIGFAIGAYGARTVRALALHGPLELAAISLAGGVYVEARNGELGASVLFVVAMVCAGLLLAAGAIETSVQIGGLQ
jgi:hypothetical protein